MNQQTDNSTAEKDPAKQSVRERSTGRKHAVWIVIAVIAIVGAAIATGLLFWPRQAGKPVPAPRSVSFEETPQAPSTAEEKLVLSVEQARAAQVKIETVGEQPAADGSGTITTGVVQANTYKETPVVSLVGGIVRAVNAELGQSVSRGRRLAVVFSNELAEAQSRYLAAVATLDEHHRHHLRTIKLVEIGAASRQDLELPPRNIAKPNPTSRTCGKNFCCWG